MSVAGGTGKRSAGKSRAFRRPAVGHRLHRHSGNQTKLGLHAGVRHAPDDKFSVSIERIPTEAEGWLFADTVGTASTSANLDSLIETATANGVEPYRYPEALFRKLPLAQTADEYEALLPWNITPAGFLRDSAPLSVAANAKTWVIDRSRCFHTADKPRANQYRA